MRKKFLLFLSLLAATTVSAQLSGTYTISGDASQNSDFVSFSEAASALAAGVSGQVVFEVAPGTYEEFVTKEYERDRDGTWLDIIPDGFDHSIDAVRYALMDDILRG